MNSYTPYLPLSYLQSASSANLFNFQNSSHFNPLLASYLASMIQDSVPSLNQKRAMFPQSNLDTKDGTRGFIPHKRFKADTKLFSSSLSAGLYKTQNNANIITLDDDDDQEDCVILDSPYKPEIPKNDILQIQVQESHVKKLEVVTIDNHEISPFVSTCQTTPKGWQEAEKEAKPSSNTISLSIGDFNTDGETDLIMPENVMEYTAKLPSFDLTCLKSQKIKSRKIKPVWNPESNLLEEWRTKIGRAVGLDITNEEKVLKTMKEFDMKIEVAMDKIKRNRAQYKTYFRVQKFEKSTVTQK